jgi:hypothetical protein
VRGGSSGGARRPSWVRESAKGRVARTRRAMAATVGAVGPREASSPTIAGPATKLISSTVASYERAVGMRSGRSRWRGAGVTSGLVPAGRPVGWVSPARADATRHARAAAACARRDEAGQGGGVGECGDRPDEAVAVAVGQRPGDRARRARWRSPGRLPRDRRRRNCRRRPGRGRGSRGRRWRREGGPESPAGRMPRREHAAGIGTPSASPMSTSERRATPATGALTIPVLPRSLASGPARHQSVQSPPWSP